MGLTVAQVTHPNQVMTEFALGPFRGRVVDITFDNSYLTTGELLTAATMGWNQVWGAIEIYPPANSAGTLMLDVVARPNTARTQIAFQAYETAGTVDTPHKEVTSAQDISAYTGRYLILGS